MDCKGCSRLEGARERARLSIGWVSVFEDEHAGGRRGQSLIPSKGLSHRAWLLVTVILGLILVSKLLFRKSQPVPDRGRNAKLIPSSASSNTHTHSLIDTAQLVPRDYINASQSDPAPFDFCPVFGPGDAIAARRGQTELLRSRLHMGTGARVQRVLNRAMSGAPLTISVLGGSSMSTSGFREWTEELADDQSRRVLELEMIQSEEVATRINSLIGGTRSFPIPPMN